ncbi:MAG: glutamine-hydrolyzing carbamoyl-phosphate synthase small subunit [Candidatus Omnitrophota bacterium]
MNSVLILENGEIFDGVSIGVSGERIGEVVLDTAVVGYQEIMSDPANAGKIVVMTYPLIGNYGVADKFYESKKCWIGGLIIKEKTRIYSNWQAEGSFDGLLKKEGIVAMEGVDTRTLAITIRDEGEMLGMISAGKTPASELMKRLKAHKKGSRIDFIRSISTKGIVEIKAKPSGPRIVVIDIGVLNSFVSQLKTLGCNITLVPYDTDAAAILGMAPDGVIISNGPEADVSLPAVAKTAKDLMGRVPLLGISTGHEVIGLALGAKLRKMKTGHHGVNYPVKPSDSWKGEITVQNHSYVIDENSLPKKGGIDVILRNLNDDSVEALESKKLRFISVQYYPSSPGFGEVNPILRRFMAMAARTDRMGSSRRPSMMHDGEIEHAKA